MATAEQPAVAVDKQCEFVLEGNTKNEQRCGMNGAPCVVKGQVGTLRTRLCDKHQRYFVERRMTVEIEG